MDPTNVTSSLRRISVKLVAFLAALGSAGCGGSRINIGCSGNCTPPAKAEFFYVVGLNPVSKDTRLNMFTANPSTGVPGPPAGVLGPIIGGPHSNGHSVFVETAPSGKFLYVTGVGGIINSNTGLGVFTIDPNSAGLSGLSLIGFNGSRSAIDAAGRFLYATDKSNPGNVAGYTINSSTGALTAIPGSPFAVGNSGNAGLAIDPGARFLYVGNVGGGITVFAIDSASGALTLVPGSPFSTLLPGSPDEIVAHPSGKFLYVTLNSSVESVEASFAVAADGSLTPTPQSAWGPNGTWAWSAALDPQGKFLYTANVNDGTISAFSVDQTTGSLTALGGSPFTFAPIQIPWDLVVDPSGKFLYVSDVSSDGIVTFNITSSGSLSPIGQQPVPVQPGTIPLKLTVVRAP
jgi:6-phosphogluconolactonase (cycloisomerase 2 family)